jgi:hypothetical protein
MKTLALEHELPSAVHQHFHIHNSIAGRIQDGTPAKRRRRFATGSEMQFAGYLKKRIR